MAWEKLNRKRSKPNHLKTTDKNPRLTVGGGGREERERQAPTYHHLRNWAYHLMKKKIITILPCPSALSLNSHNSATNILACS